MLAVLALVVWLTTGQGDGKKPAGKTAQPAPAQSITPGATPTGPAITSRPGGSGGTSGGGGVSGGGGGEVSLTGGASGSGGAGGTGGSAGSSTGGAAGSSGGSGGGSGGSGGAVTPPPVNTAEVIALPLCTASQVTLELAGTQSSFESKDKPRLALTVRNTSGANCRVDLGRTASAIVVTSAANDRIWSSADCPTDKQSTWVEIASGSGLTETFTWDRSRSKPQCAPPDASTAQPGNYLVQATLTGPSGGPVSARTSIRLDG
ncbi:hypothetical protein UK12_10945 [Saccharothrix sp. ST-888]|nr:hypothetical protein UK12_10945 [Saccharothrix sp. ST-888]